MNKTTACLLAGGVLALTGCETASRPDPVALEAPPRARFGRPNAPDEASRTPTARIPAAAAAASPAPVAAVEPREVPPARGAGKAVLLIGDSHTAQLFGKTLEGKLRESSGDAVTAVGLPNATTAWFAGKRLNDLLEKSRPDTTIVALGSNGLADDDVRRIVEAIHARGSACVWVGPPDMRTTRAVLAGYYETLGRNGVAAGPTLESSRKEGCLLVDSREFSYLRYPDKGGDGIHYLSFGDLDLSAQGRRWAEDVFRVIGARLLPAS